MSYLIVMQRLSVFAALGLAMMAPAAAQSSIDEVERDLNQFKTQHDQASSQVLTNFFSQLDAASQSGGVALDLYKRAGGDMPDLAPVHKHYEYETPTEKAAREAQDAQAYASVAVVVQIHCGLMRNAAALALQPKSQEVHDKWVAWLKTMAQVYPQLAGERALKRVSMRDSKISDYLNFHGWGNSEEGGWSIHDMPRLYKELVLQPLRNPPGPGTLDAWDTYEAMVQADDPDHDHYVNVTEPPLDFDRAADDFAIDPTMEKLTTLDQIIKGNQASDHLDEWVARTRQMIAVYRASGSNHTPLPGPSTSASSPGTTGTTPGATPGTMASGTAGTTPGATPGTPSSGGGAPTPAPSPGTPASGGGAPTPTASPGVTTSGGTAPTPTASPGTPTSGGTASTPTATP